MEAGDRREHSGGIKWCAALGPSAHSVPLKQALLKIDIPGSRTCILTTADSLARGILLQQYSSKTSGDLVMAAESRAKSIATAPRKNMT